MVIGRGGLGDGVNKYIFNAKFRMMRQNVHLMRHSNDHHHTILYTKHIRIQKIYCTLEYNVIMLLGYACWQLNRLPLLLIEYIKPLVFLLTTITYTYNTE